MSDFKLSKDSIEAGLSFCRWQHMKQFNAWVSSVAPSLPKKHAPVLLNDRGKRVYDLVLKQITPPDGAVLTSEGERKAVVKLLCELKDRRPPQGSSRRPSGGVKHATLQLSSITKFMGGGKRTIRGLANSGLIDRVGDIVDPEGGRWELPVSLLWQHKHDQPIGWVRSIEARSDGLWITAELAEGIGKADEAWKMIEAGLVNSYSIGFQPTDWKALPGGGKRFTSWDLLEISVVTIPADPAARIRRSTGTGAGVPLVAGNRSRGVPLTKRGDGVRLVRAGR